MVHWSIMHPNSEKTIWSPTRRRSVQNENKNFKQRPKTKARNALRNAWTKLDPKHFQENEIERERKRERNG